MTIERQVIRTILYKGSLFLIRDTFYESQGRRVGISTIEYGTRGTVEDARDICWHVTYEGALFEHMEPLVTLMDLEKSWEEG